MKYLKKYQRKVKGQAEFCAHQGRDCECKPGYAIFYGTLDLVDWNTNDVINEINGDVLWDAESPRIHKNALLNVTKKFEYRIFEKEDQNIIECNNAIFGGDPEPFIPKFCWCYIYEPPSDDFVGNDIDVVEIDEGYIAMIAELEEEK